MRSRTGRRSDATGFVAAKRSFAYHVSIETAVDVLVKEIDAIKKLGDNLDENFTKAENMIFSSISSNGKVIITGIGKSGIIGKKISATMTSLGIPSVFIHSLEALHGDIGIVRKGDVAILFSNSGKTIETINIAKILKTMGSPIIAVTNKPNSMLGKFSDIIIFLGGAPEADHLELAPTSSTTAMLVLGDALAVSISKSMNFRAEDFVKFHPQGALGKKAREKDKGKE